MRSIIRMRSIISPIAKHYLEQTKIPGNVPPLKREATLDANRDSWRNPTLQMRGIVYEEPDNRAVFTSSNATDCLVGTKIPGDEIESARWFPTPKKRNPGRAGPPGPPPPSPQNCQNSRKYPITQWSENSASSTKNGLCLRGVVKTRKARQYSTLQTKCFLQ